MDEKELNVVLKRRDDSTAGLGFSLLDKPGFPPVIYDIEENSPAAESGKVEAGDVILKINDVDVGKYSIKEDQSLKEKILYYLSTTTENAENELLNAATQQTTTALTNGNGVASRHHQSNNVRGSRKESAALQYSSSAPSSSPLQDITSSRKYENDVAVSPNARVSPSPVAGNASTAQQPTTAVAGTPQQQQQPLCEAYMMTGERVLKLTKNTSLGLKFQKKIDSLRAHNVRRNLATATANNQGNGRYNKSTPSSPVESDYSGDLVRSSSANSSPTMDASPLVAAANERGNCSPYAASVSKSDDDIQYKKEISVSSASVQVDDEDITSSLNTLLDTTTKTTTAAAAAAAKSEGKTDDKRSFWTCTNVTTRTQSSRQQRSGGDGVSMASPENESSRQSCSPPSPTSVSSSAMSLVSSATDRKRAQRASLSSNNNSDSSQIEAVSNISSPDYQEETSDLLNLHDVGMEVADPSDSDSTLLASEPRIRRLNKRARSDKKEQNGLPEKSNHRIVIQVKGVENDDRAHNFSDANAYVVDNSNHRNCNITKLSQYTSLREEDEDSENNDDPKNVGYEALSEYDDELYALTEGAANLAKSISPPHSGSSEDESGSDAESLRHYSPKGVDVPSAMRLAHRLYTLDKFKKSDVCRHLSKNNEFSRVVAEEYLKHFDFENNSLDEALRKFLKQFSLTGETQERERVLVHFSKRYLDCNPGSFNSQDGVHTLTCAIMLLNTDLHGPNIGRKMSCSAFIENLSGLNEGENFPRDVLKALYQAIKNSPLEWAVDDEIEDNVTANSLPANNRIENYDLQNEYLARGEMLNKDDMNANGEPCVIDYKKGYVMRKCCYESNGKKTPFGKRGWKMMHCTLRDLVLYLHKDEQDVYKTQPDSAHNVIRLHHALATKATDYTKKQRVFRLKTADRAEYLFQTSDDKELQSWVDTINLVCASFSAPALPEPVGSLKKFQRPLLPSAPSKLNLRDQLKEHEQTVERLEKELENHRKQAPDKSAKNLVVQNHSEKESYLCYEVKRYKTYVCALQSKLPQILPVMMSSVPLADIESDDEGVLCGSTATSTVVEEADEACSPVSLNRARSKMRNS